jgi:hypothetical protein
MKNIYFNFDSFVSQLRLVGMGVIFMLLRSLIGKRLDLVK